jgi:PIN domain nuclease of toxin-antitoxin system
MAALPPIHADPFDRMLLAQATAEQMTLLTADKAVLAYGDPAQPA